MQKISNSLDWFPADDKGLLLLSNVLIPNDFCIFGSHLGDIVDTNYDVTDKENV